MSHLHEQPRGASARTLAAVAPRLQMIGLIAAVAGIVLGVLLSLLGGEHKWQVLGISYVVGFSFFLTISLSALFFVIIHHLVRAGWSTTTRRIMEVMSVNLITMAVLAIPLVILAAITVHDHSMIYHWVHPGDDAALQRKSVWLNLPFFTLRLAIYFAITIGAAMWFWRKSLRQDQTGDVALTETMQRYAGGWALLFALTMTFVAFDVLMSLDPHWFSTVFGVYVFAGGNLAFFSVMTLFTRFIQRRGILTNEVTPEHYHDFGKWMFAWTFFWGYIAFSQYMLIWYANMPEETGWFHRRGASTHDLYHNAWGIISLALLFGHLLIPFAGLLSRHVKRHAAGLSFWAVWLLVFHFLDLAWISLPQTGWIQGMVDANPDGSIGPQIVPLLVQLGAALCFTVGIGGVWLIGLVKIAGDRPIIPVADPRLEESLAFHNI